ncbi:t-SNARE [Coniophora puteana RWD-64-598 SS2]|uniref:t-SNARE n=1 Tax=Coniophora puteana (strain RWD-64-598) TaxID=741705 RepID=A0A5M3MW40_CONPW|nr:t-SNARE [Coniophora puteana RWD-64-598 SS2]EIW83207.1 t-SNARE [Coniophora puteana RWD-64-598 SS2]
MSSSPSPSSQPTTRSRTGLFISYRDSRAPSSRFSRPQSSYDEAYGDDSENERLIGSSSRHVAIDVNLPPKWVDVSDEVEEILGGTQLKIASLEKLHAKHALPGFADRTAEEREIETATTEITRDFRRCQALIQRIEADQKHAFPPGRSASSHELKAAKNVQRGLAAKVQDLSSTFRKKQRVYLERIQGHAIKNQDLLIASGAISSRGVDAMTALDDDIEAANQSQVQATESAPAHDFQQRNRELTEIASSIAQLAELFKDLSVLVIDQGTLLDSVEYNIEQTAAQVSEAVQELNVATRYQKNTGRRKIIFLLLLIIFGLIIVLIFKPRRHASDSDLSSTSTSTGASSVSEDASVSLKDPLPPFEEDTFRSPVSVLFERARTPFLHLHSDSGDSFR